MNDLGLLSILVCWAGLFFMIWKWKGNGTMTYSRHAIHNRSSLTFYIALWLVVLPFFYWFMMNPFAEKLELGILYKACITLGTISMLGAVVVPELAGWKYVVHRIFAYSMAVSLLPTLVLIALSEKIQMASLVVILLSIAFMLWSIVYLWFDEAVKNKDKRNPHTLLLQSLYVAVFHVSILLAYYL